MIEPTKRELDVLRALSGGVVAGRGGLPFIGEKTITDMLAKNWIVEATEAAPSQKPGYRITDDGEAARARGRTPRKQEPARLKTLRPRLQPLKTWADR